MMNELLTPAARRTVALCRRVASGATTPQTWSDFLMLALLQQESLAAAALHRLGVSVESLLVGRHSPEALERVSRELDHQIENAESDDQLSSSPAANPDDPLEFTQILDRAVALARREGNATGVSSAHLLIAVFETNKVLQQQFTDSGVDREQIIAELNLETIVTGPSLPIDFDLNWSSDSSLSVPSHLSATQSQSERLNAAWRIIDANLNRSREGLRVLEDYARFVQNDQQLSGHLKDLRHQLVASEALLRIRNYGGLLESHGRFDSPLLRHRDTAHDVGTQLSTAAENLRVDMADVVIANSRRVQEALRSLEEFGKLVSPEFAAAVKQIRYRSYTAQQEFNIATGSQSSLDLRGRRIEKLHSSVVYVLITEAICRLPWQQVVDATLQGGADVLQLREKHLNDDELLRRARWMSDACREAGRLFIMNDRVDIAVLSGADGVHVGQDELSMADVRSVLRPDQIAGVSTHSLQQALAAQGEGADYIGVGPTFPSETKHFANYPGLELVKNVLPRIRIPAFAIGGINATNVSAVLEAGGNRVAVTSFVASSDNPAFAVRELQSLILRQ